MKRTLRDAFDRWKDALIMRGVMSQDYQRVLARADEHHRDQIWRGMPKVRAKAHRHSNHDPKQQTEGPPSAPGTQTVTHANRIHTPRFRESRRPGSHRSAADNPKGLRPVGSPLWIGRT